MISILSFDISNFWNCLKLSIKRIRSDYVAFKTLDNDIIFHENIEKAWLFVKSFTLAYVFLSSRYSRVGRGKLVLRHFTPHYLTELWRHFVLSGGIQRRLLLQHHNEEIKILLVLFPGMNPQAVVFTATRLYPCATTGLKPFFEAVMALLHKCVTVNAMVVRSIRIGLIELLYNNVFITSLW